MRLKDKRVIVTAAASGMVRAGAELFLREGASVVDVAGEVSEAGLAVLSKDPGAGDRLHTIRADPSQPEGIRSSINDGAALLGGVDMLWAQASTPGPGGGEALDVEAYNLAMTLNLTSATLAAGELIAHMRKAGQARSSSDRRCGGWSGRCSARSVQWRNSRLWA